MRALACIAMFCMACSSGAGALSPDGGVADGPGPDLGNAAPDLAKPPTPLIPASTGSCDPTVVASDGQACSAGCGANALCAGYDSATLKCYAVCDPATANSCPCGRRCTPITKPDGSTTSACLPANGPGERCGNDAGGNVYGYPNCADGLTCAGSPSLRYCVYSGCMTSNDCPQQTTCTAVVSNQMVSSLACWYNSDAMGKAIGSACTLADFCVTGSLCDGTCRKTCNGPGDASCAATETCAALKDGAKVIGYVCK